MNAKIIDILLAAQAEINDLARDDAIENDSQLHVNDFRSRLLFADLGNGLDIEYYGDVWDEGEPCAWGVFLDALTQPDIANNLCSLRITGADEGANGSRTHDFAALLATKANFPNLIALTIRQTSVTDHNFVDIEDGQLTPLIARCPNLQSLTLPQAPTPDFFKLPLPDLWHLNIGMHWQTHGFIKHLSASNNMPKLMVFSFSDSLSVFETQDKATKQAQTDENNKNLTNPNPALHQLLLDSGLSRAELDEMHAILKAASQEAEEINSYDDSVTPFADYCALFESKRLKQRSVFHLRNALLTEAEFKQLQTLRLDLQFSASLETPHVYVSHWDGKFSKPFKHLIIK